MFDVGQRVVCISKGPWSDMDTREPTDVPPPLFQHTYLVEEVRYVGRFVSMPDGSNRPLIALRLAGFPYGWDSVLFRPVEERKTSIEVFTKLLAPTPKVVEKV